MGDEGGGKTEKAGGEEEGMCACVSVCVYVCVCVCLG